VKKDAHAEKNEVTCAVIQLMMLEPQPWGLSMPRCRTKSAIGLRGVQGCFGHRAEDEGLIAARTESSWGSWFDISVLLKEAVSSQVSWTQIFFIIKRWLIKGEGLESEHVS
jgi:hypothetical protein